jgi:beta-phosphoglucomutase family hydrolase
MLKIPPDTFDAYIFDCDGTIANSMPLHFVAWCEELSKHGIQFSEHLFYEWAGIPVTDIIGRLNALHGLSLNPDEVVRAKEVHYTKLLPSLEPIAPVVEQIKLHHGKKPLAVASGSHRQTIVATLKTLGLLEKFDVIVGAEDYQKGKPAPDAFLKAAARMGVKPERCLVFEDAQLGIEAARAAGMQWVFVPKFPLKNPLKPIPE